MKRKVVAMLLLVLWIGHLGAQNNSVHGYESYVDSEFPRWSRLLRRGEALFFGSLPVTYAFTSLGYSAARALGADSFAREGVALISIAAGLSLAIAITDYIIGEVQRE